VTAPHSSSRRRALVTGAAGFLGRHVVRALVADGWEVVAFDQPSARLEVPPGVRAIAADIADLAPLRSEIAGAQAICHLAAFVPPSYDDPAHVDRCLQVNGAATLHLARLAAERPGCRFIYLSAGNAYAPSPTPVAEDHPVNPAGPAAAYLSSKVLGEMFVEQTRRSRGLDAVSLRLSTPYGPGMPERTAVARFMACARRGAPIEVRDGGTATFDFVYVADVAGAILAALKSGAAGVYNIGSGRARSVLELAKTVAAIFREKDVMLDVRRSSGPAFSGFPALNIDKAARTWGFRPRPLDEGLIEYRRQMETTP
jgi:UDP-glucose 4-epimerase